MKYKQKIARVTLFLGDVLLFYAALLASLTLRYHGYSDEPALILRHIFPFSITFAVWLITFASSGFYEPRMMKNSKHFLYRLLRAMAANTVLAIVVFYIFLPNFEIEPRRNLFLISLAATIFIFIWRTLFNLLILKTPSSRVLFFGINKETIELSHFLLMHPQLGQKPIAFISSNGDTMQNNLPLPHFPIGEHIRDTVKEQNAETIVISSEIKENKTLVSMLFQVIPLGVGVVEFPRFYEMFTGKVPLSLIGEIWFLENLVGIKKNFYEFFKRVVDITLAVIVGIPALLLLPLIASLIQFESEGPIFYRQRRVGRNGREFRVFKFRSMVKDADKMSGAKGNGPDPRHTAIGGFLRKSYIDELPQIINILKGEMSFVGPRPERPEYIEELKKKIPFYEMRLLVPPGITGWAQINMEDDASVEDAPEKMQYDLYYIKNRNLILDLLVALRTASTMLRRQGR